MTNDRSVSKRLIGYFFINIKYHSTIRSKLKSKVVQTNKSIIMIFPGRSLWINYWFIQWIYLCFIYALTLQSALAANPPGVYTTQYSGGSLPPNLCTLYTSVMTETPCLGWLTDETDQQVLLGEGILKQTEDGKYQCQLLLALTYSQWRQHSLVDSLVELSSTNVSPIGDGQYNVYHYPSSVFNLIHCPENTHLHLTESLLLQLFYGKNPSLKKPSPYDNHNVINGFTGLVESVRDQDRFFHCSENSASCEDDVFCDNVCPSGFSASNSRSYTKVKRCNQPNQAVPPFFNRQSPYQTESYDFSFYCEKCQNDTYRYAFPIQKATNLPHFEFKCQYNCEPYQNCTAPFRTAFEGSSNHNRVCDCQDYETRVVLQQPDIIKKSVMFASDGIPSLANLVPDQWRARYDQYADSDGNVRNYDFLCQSRSQYCLTHNKNLEWAIGIRFNLSDSESDCYIIDESQGIYANTEADTNLFLTRGSDPSEISDPATSIPGTMIAAETSTFSFSSLPATTFTVSNVPNSTSTEYQSATTLNLTPTGTATPPAAELPPWVYYSAIGFGLLFISVLTFGIAAFAIAKYRKRGSRIVTVSQSSMQVNVNYSPTRPPVYDRISPNKFPYVQDVIMSNVAYDSTTRVYETIDSARNSFSNFQNVLDNPMSHSPSVGSEYIEMADVAQ